MRKGRAGMAKYSGHTARQTEAIAGHAHDGPAQVLGNMVSQQGGVGRGLEARRGRHLLGGKAGLAHRHVSAVDAEAGTGPVDFLAAADANKGVKGWCGLGRGLLLLSSLGWCRRAAFGGAVGMQQPCNLYSGAAQCVVTSSGGGMRSVEARAQRSQGVQMLWVSAQVFLEVDVVGELLLADVAEESKGALVDRADVHSQRVSAVEAQFTQRAGVTPGATAAVLSVCCCGGLFNDRTIA